MDVKMKNAKLDNAITIWLLMFIAVCLGVAALTGCSAVAAAPTEATPRDVVDDDGRAYVRWSLAEPEDAGRSKTGAGEHLWSTAPEGGAVFGLTFRVPVVGLRFEAPRSRLVIGADADIAGASLLAWFGSDAGACYEWEGTYRVDRDDVRGWALEIDAECDGRRLAGRWSGDS